MKAHFDTFARYNRWANRRLYDAVAELSDAQFREDRGAFFGSLRGTLNHLLVGDRLWFGRIEGTGPMPTRLDEILHDRFDDLRAAREAEDERILRVVGGLDEARLAATFAYRTIKGEACEQPLAPVLAHVFNHQTHHRGQAHTLLSQFGREAPAIDLIYFLREPG
ncbi:DinB family protein [Azospirillum sp.]|uniref:DinB family protein n=1 Tax=Azospirillum sp. TaxID=34012 RepID=UPI002D53948E|nr:DinB family protein [Azospirillum sp.]HYD67035.1 DinB family protein [Azospirillum sp.]